MPVTHFMLLSLLVLPCVSLAAEEPAKKPLTFKVPEGWKEVDPGGFALAKYEIGADAAKAVASVTILGWREDQLVPNINRWRAQVGLEQVSAEEVKKSLREVEVDGAKGWAVDLQSPATADKAQRTLGAIVPRGETAVFIKLMGPPKTVAGEVDRFDAFMKSIKFVK